MLTLPGRVTDPSHGVERIVGDGREEEFARITGLRPMMSDSQPNRMSVGVPMTSPIPTMRELVSVSTFETVCK